MILPDQGTDHPAPDRLASVAEDLHRAAEMEACALDESFAGEAQHERKLEIQIKWQDAERYFDEEIGDWRTSRRCINTGPIRVKTRQPQSGTQSDGLKAGDASPTKNKLALKRNHTSRPIDPI